MTEMRGDIVNRVRRLPKPSKSAEALQPLFETVSNAMHAVEELFEADAILRGRIQVTVNNLKTPSSIEVIVADNGIGLSDDRFRAFCTTDTDFKVKRGGKGVGRLLWLDAFERINVTSTYENKPDLNRRSFRFQLAPKEQITDEKIENAEKGEQRGTIIRFVGLRGNAYSGKFPSQAAALWRGWL